MGAYQNDDRVLPRDNGQWVIFGKDVTVWYVIPFGEPWQDLWYATDTAGRLVTAEAAGFDDTVHALIGDPQ